MVSVRGHPDVSHRSVMQYNAVQGLLEIKDKHSPWEGPMLLGRDLPEVPMAVCVFDFEQPLYGWTP